jgi:hypothetical protein
MHAHIPLPRARTAELITTEVGDQVLVYDLQRHHIHHLNPTSATVWQLCDGRRTVGDLARAAGIDDEAARLAVRQLADADLLDGTLSPEVGSARQSRRRFMKRAAIAGVAVPVIVSVSAPQAAAQSSALCGGIVCGPNQTCAVCVLDRTLDTCCPDFIPAGDCGHTDCPSE